jgi:hypothetical protein
MKRFTLILASFLVSLFSVQAQTLTSKANLKRLYPALPPSFYKTAYSFRFDEETECSVNFASISINLNKIKAGDEKPGKPVKVITPKYNEKKVLAQSAFSIGQQVYLLAKHEDKKLDKITYLVYKVDFNTMTLDQEGKVVETYTDLKGENHSLNYEIVDDKSLLITRTVSNKKEDESKLYFVMFDKEINKLWEHEVVPPIANVSFGIERYFFKDENSLVMSCIEYPDGFRKMKKQGKANYKYHVFYFTNKMTSVKDYEIELTGKFITDLSLGINSSGQIVCSGFYSEKDLYKLSGCFYMCINAETKKVEKSSLKEFDNEFVLSLMTKKQKRKASKKADKGDDIDAQQFDLRNLYFDEQGNVLLIAEDYYVTYHCTRDSKGNTNCYYLYHYDDIIAVSISASGDIAWTTKIDKKLTFGAPVGKSFITIIKKGKWVFIYNENLDNLEDEEDENSDKSAGGRNSAPVIVILDGNGKFTKEVLMMPEGKRAITIANYDVELPNGAHIVEITNKEGTYAYRMDLKL